VSQFNRVMIAAAFPWRIAVRPVTTYDDLVEMSTKPSAVRGHAPEQKLIDPIGMRRHEIGKPVVIDRHTEGKLR
jgi:hypothetical protein